MWSTALHKQLRGIICTNLMLFSNNFCLHGMFLDCMSAIKMNLIKLRYKLVILHPKSKLTCSKQGLQNRITIHYHLLTPTNQLQRHTATQKDPTIIYNHTLPLITNRKSPTATYNNPTLLRKITQRSTTTYYQLKKLYSDP